MMTFEQSRIRSKFDPSFSGTEFLVYQGGKGYRYGRPSADLAVPATRRFTLGDRAFAVAGPRAWMEHSA